MRRKTGGPLRLASVITCITFLAGSIFISTAFSSPFASVRSGLYKDRNFTEPVTAFTPYEKFFLLVELRQLQAGTYTLTTDWLTPWGELEHQSNYSFSIIRTSPSWKACSWLTLWKNGPVKRFLTGEVFKKKFYGNWTVRLYLNGREIEKKSFTVQ